MKPISVLIADDDPGILQGLGALVAEDPELDLVALAMDADQAVEMAREMLPDVALVDVRMPRGGGVRATREIRASGGPTRIIAHSAYRDRSLVVEMLEAGATGYLVKGRRGSELLETIHRCAAGQSALSPEITGDVISQLVGQLHEDTEPTAPTAARSRIEAVLDGDALSVVFQPIFDLQSGRIAGAEALARFATDPPRPPDEWFADADKAGLLTQLETAAIRTALSHFDTVPGDAFLTLNVSPHSLGAGALDESLHGLALDRLVLEVTEHAPVEDYEGLNGGLEQARRKGLRIAVDDAGAGFASFRHVIKLRPDFIKIDISIVRGIDEDDVRRAVALSLVWVANEMGASVIAEGIESEAELRTLRGLGVKYGQGYHLSKPLCPEEICWQAGTPAQAAVSA